MVQPQSSRVRPELVCPAGSLRALQLAVDAGADAVYLGLKDATNARNFAGLNFDDAQVREGVAYAHARGARGADGAEHLCRCARRRRPGSAPSTAPPRSAPTR